MKPLIRLTHVRIFEQPQKIFIANDSCAIRLIAQTHFPNASMPESDGNPALEGN